MHNPIVKSFFALFLILLLSGCSNNSLHYKEISKNYEQDNMEASMIYPHIYCIGKEDFCEKINNEIESKILAQENDFIQKSKLKDNEKTKKLSINYSTEETKSNIYSIIVNVEEDYGDAKIIKDRFCVNVDLETCTKLSLPDIFNDDSYVNMLNQKMYEITDTDEYSDLWDTPKIGENEKDNFYFTTKGIVIFYKPYELSYYSRGFVEVLVPYKKMYGFLNTRYNYLN